MRTILIIGIGTGNPAHMTLEGIAALERADVVFVPTKGAEKERLAAIRRSLLTRFAGSAEVVEFALPVREVDNPDYAAGVSAWHAAIAEKYRSMIAGLDPDACAALLVWGDPGLYDSTLRILNLVKEAGESFSVRVIPGITAIAALTSAFAIPLNTIGNPVTITTGRRLLEGWPTGADSVVVMLDGGKSFARIDPADIHIHWAAYVGMDEQILIEGPLAEVADRVATARDAARARHGWIMDIYLLRKPSGRV